MALLGYTLPASVSNQDKAARLVLRGHCEVINALPKLTWKWRGAPQLQDNYVTILYIGPSISFHVKLGEGTFFPSLKNPVANNNGLLSINYGLLWGMVACYFGLLGFPGPK